MSLGDRNIEMVLLRKVGMMLLRDGYIGMMVMSGKYILKSMFCFILVIIIFSNSISHMTFLPTYSWYIGFKSIFELIFEFWQIGFSSDIFMIYRSFRHIPDILVLNFCIKKCYDISDSIILKNIIIITNHSVN